MNRPSSELPISKALFWIFISTLIISGSSWMAFAFYRGFFNSRVNDPRYHIVALVQTGPEREALKTSYLAELLALSVDQPKNLYQLDLKEERKKMLSQPLIRSCTLKRIPPGTLYVDYSVRCPLAFLTDYSNTAVDEEGVLLPFKPFFFPKKLPEIYLGLDTEDALNWGDKLMDPKWLLALNVMKEGLKAADLHRLDLVQVDVSQAFAESFGQRQIVLTMRKFEKKYLLRLPVKNFINGLQRFSLLNLENGEKDFHLAIDLRIENLAFYQPFKE